METENSFQVVAGGARGGDGRPLSPNDNGGPRMEDSGGHISTVTRYGYGLALLGLLGLSAGFFVHREGILNYLEKNGYTVDQFLDALREMLS